MPSIQFGAERHFTEIAAIIPGFAGYYFDRDANLRVRLTDTAYADDARAMLQAKLQLVRGRLAQRNSNPRIIVQSARYDFLQLSAWRRTLRLAGMPAIHGLHSLSIQQARNVVQVGVSSPSDKSAIEALAAELGIPFDGISVRIASPPVMLLTLWDNVDPPGGGLRIQRGDGAGCSYGATIYGGDAFLTASHCSTTSNNQQKNVDGTVYYQPNTQYAPLGYETNDPPVFDWFGAVECPQYSLCRWSDASIASFYSSRQAAQGKLMRTPNAYYHYGGPDLTINGTFTVINDWSYPVEGQILEKLGATTGATYGEVVDECYDTRAGFTSPLYLCQAVVWADAGLGDSGGPVYEVLGSTSVYFYGLVVAFSNEYGGAVFSYLDAIWFELGGFTTAAP